MAETFRVPQGVQDEAKMSLGWIADGHAGNGFTAVGKKRASDLAAGHPVSAETILRMYSFFKRHEVDKRAEGFNSGEDGFPSPGRVAWSAWGGDAGFTWSTRIRNQLDNNVRALQQMTSEEGEIMVDPTTSDLITENPMQEETMSPDAVLHSVMAADAAMDVAQGLLANNPDPVISQAYYLICAADAALSEIIEALGGMDEDDEKEVVGETMPMPMVMSAYSEDVSELTEEERASAARIGEGSFVSWNTSNGRAKGKVEKVVTKGQAKSSEGYVLETTPDQPAFSIRIYKEQGNGWIPTDVTVVHRPDILTVITALPAPRSEDVEMIEERKTAMAQAERITMSAEVRAVATDDGSLKIGGYAATFNSEATGLNFREVIAPGAFTRALSSGDPVFLLVNHDMEGIPLASTQSGTLKLRQDATGLYMEATLDAANPKAQELSSALRRGDMDKMSFAFTVSPDGQTKDAGLRTLTDIERLYEVSVVTLPAYDATSVGMRSAEEADLELAKRKLSLKVKQYSLTRKGKA